jgi:transcriptional regulator
MAPIRWGPETPMYVPAHFALTEDQCWDAITEVVVGHLVVGTSAGLQAVFAPVLVDRTSHTLRGHVARANPWWRDGSDGDEIVGLFTLAQAYVSPNLYPGKSDDPAVVPTWDYVAIEARGRLIVRDNAEFVEEIVRSLTDQMEHRRAAPWSVDDAPYEYVEKLRRRIVGFEVNDVTVSGAAKLSQNKDERDRAGVERAFRGGSKSEQIVAEQMGRER